MKYFSRYRTLYFYDSFEEGQGTEEILEVLASVNEAESWLDLGCGPTTMFWSIPLNIRSRIDCCDNTAEALKVLHDLVLSGEVPPCYQQVLTRYGRDRRHLLDVRRKIGNFIVHDALNVPLCEILSRQYDLITAIGLLGLANDAGHYTSALGNAARELAPGGYLAGADWIRSPKFIREERHDNSYIDEILISRAADKHGLNILSLRKVSIRDDPLYSDILVWLMQRNKL